MPWCRGWYAANEQRVNGALVPRVVRGENSEEATGKEPKGEQRATNGGQRGGDEQRERRTDPKSKEANGEATGEGDRRTARRRASLKATNADSERRRGDGVGDGNGAGDGHGVGGDGDGVGDGDGDAAVRWPPGEQRVALVPRVVRGERSEQSTGWRVDGLTGFSSEATLARRCWIEGDPWHGHQRKRERKEVSSELSAKGGGIPCNHHPRIPLFGVPTNQAHVASRSPSLRHLPDGPRRPTSAKEGKEGGVSRAICEGGGNPI